MTDTTSLTIPKDSTGWKLAIATTFSTLIAFGLARLDESVDWQKVVPVLSPFLGVLISEGLVALNTSTFINSPEEKKLRKRITQRMETIAEQLEDPQINEETKQALREKYNADALALAQL